MPNDHGRGRTANDHTLIRRSHLDRTTRTITLVTDGNPDGDTIQFPETTAGHQLLHAVWAQIPQAQQGGNWASAVTATGYGRQLVRLLEELDPAFDFADPDVGADVFEILVRKHGGSARSSRKALARAFLDNHPDGAAIAGQIDARKIPTPTPDLPPLLTDDEYDLVKTTIRDRFLDHFLTFKNTLADGGIDVTQRHWVNLPADAIVDQLHTHDTPAAARLLDRIATGADRVLHPHSDTLATCLFHLAMASDKGPNESAMLSLTENSITEQRSTMHKRRGAGAVTVHATGADLASFNGVATAIRALTTFNRQQRRDTADGDPVLERNATLLFVPAGRRTTLEYGKTSTARTLRDAVRDLTGRDTALGLALIRRTLVHRTRRDTGTDQTVGHTYVESGAYLARNPMSPYEDELYRDVLDDIEQLTDLALDLLTARTEQDPPDSDNTAGVNRAITVCATDGIDPTTDHLCNRGLVGCMFCTEARLTEANIPAHKAVLHFSETVRDHDPHEWKAGPGPLLHKLSTKALDRFDPGVVDEAPDGTQMLPTIIAHYLEVRG